MGGGLSHHFSPSLFASVGIGDEEEVGGVGVDCDGGGGGFVEGALPP